MGSLFIETKQDKDVVLLTLKGEIDSSTLNNLKEVLDNCQRNNTFKLAIDFKEVNYINSRGVGTLLETVKIFRNEGGDVKLINISKKVFRVLKLIGLDKVVRIYPSYSDAVSAFSKNKQEEEFTNILFAFREEFTNYKTFLPEILSGEIGEIIGKAEQHLKEEKFPLALDEFKKIVSSLSAFKKKILGSKVGEVKTRCPACDAPIEEKGEISCFKCGELLIIEGQSVTPVNQRKLSLLKLYIPSEEIFLGSIRILSSNLASDIGMETESIEKIEMAVDEVCSNIIEHAHNGEKSQRIELDFILDSGQMKIVIIDQCQDKEKVNGAAAIYGKNKEVFKKQTEGHKSSGMGVRLIKNFMDTVEYIPRTGVGNILRMTKKIKKG
jgi:anti-anti-sigma factor